MSSDLLKRIYKEGDIEDFVEVLHDTGWESDGKYDLRTLVVNLVPFNVEEELGSAWPALVPGEYVINLDRTGSYYSDYEYGEPHIYPARTWVEDVPTLKWEPL